MKEGRKEYLIFTHLFDSVVLLVITVLSYHFSDPLNSKFDIQGICDIKGFTVC